MNLKRNEVKRMPKAKAKETDQTKEIKKQITAFKKLFKPLLDSNTYTIAEGLISNAAFMSVTLNKLQQDIAINGVSEVYQNGSNQSGIKESTSIKVYNNMIRSYTSVVKNLIGLVPEDKQVEVGSQLTAFLQS